MSRHNRDRRKDRPKNPFTQPLSERRIVTPTTYEELGAAIERGDVVKLDGSHMDDIFTPEINARLDALDPTIRDFTSLSSPEAMAYSEEARLVVRVYLEELQTLYREYRREADLGQPIVAFLFDLRYDYGRYQALEIYPNRRDEILGQYEASRSVPNGVPAFWHLRPRPETLRTKPMAGRYEVVVFGPCPVVIQLPIPV